MEPIQTEFNRGNFQPVECVKEAWALIKDRYWLFFGITAVGVLIGSLFAIILMGPMLCGIYFCLFRRMRGEQVEFGDLFRGFDYFGQSVIATLLQAVPILVIAVPFYLFMMFQIVSTAAAGSSGAESGAAFGLFTATMGLFILVMIVLAVAVTVLCMFVYPLIVDKKLSGVDALRTSITAAWANLGSLIVVALINVALSIVGVLLCYVGAFFVLPITLTTQAVVYRKLFPLTPGTAPPPIA